MADKRFGVREICNVVLRAKRSMTLGNTSFTKDAPVLVFRTLKTSSLEGAASTVYAQGGPGNARLVAWEGEKTVTFTMEDALISPYSFAVLSGAGLIEYDGSGDGTYVHEMEETELIIETTSSGTTTYKVNLENSPAPTNADLDIFAYMIPLDDNGDVAGAPVRVDLNGSTGDTNNGKSDSTLSSITFGTSYADNFKNGMGVIVDYYVYKESGVKQIEITASKFAGNYYLEADTLWRDQSGVDYAAQFIIPNCKIQSNWNFTMAATGDPSTFTFTMDAFPDYLKFDKSKKVIAALQIIDENDGTVDTLRNYEATANASLISNTNEDAEVKDYITGYDYDATTGMVSNVEGGTMFKINEPKASSSSSYSKTAYSAKATD